MKNSILFLCTLGLLLVLFSCEKEEAIELADKTEPTQQGVTKDGFDFTTAPPTGCHTGDPTSSFRISPYVRPSGTCWGASHSGYQYDVVVYVNQPKPYTRRVSIYGWINNDRSSLPNTYTIDIPANSSTSSRNNAFAGASRRYNSMLVEVVGVLKQTNSGWAPETDYRATCAAVPINNCYSRNNDGGGVGF